MAKFDEVLLRNAKRLREDVRRRDSGDLLTRHVPTGFRVIDSTFGGIRLGCLTELLAHTGAGKSTWARQVAEGAARAGAGVLMFSVEDPESATAERVLADGTGITATEIGRLDLEPGELDRLEAAAVAAGPWAARIEAVFDTPSVDDVLTAIDDTTAVGAAPLKLCILDYAQALGDESSLESELARLARGLNERAGQREIATLLLSQVAGRVLERGREEYTRTKSVSGFVPGLGDSEWCRRIEKSAKAVWALDRPGMWRRAMGEDAEDNEAELHVRKANFGATGWERLGWSGPECRFLNL